jgi:histone-lysine N-methyltransferase SETMAR
MLYEYSRGSNARQTCIAINNVYGEGTISHSTCDNWFTKFRSGDTSLEDEPGRGADPKIDDNALLHLLAENNRFSTRELGETLGVSHITIENHLHNLGFLWIFGKWLPHDLTIHQKGQRASIAAAHLSRHEIKSFLPHIITGDEKWITYVNLSRKRQWVGPGSTPSPDVKPDVHEHKIMLCVWWDMEGPIYWEVLDDKVTVNAALYTQQLDRLAAAVAENRPDKKKIMLLHDNARPHTAKLTQAKIKGLGWEVLAHPLYSPDLALSDYHLFRSLASALKDQHFDTADSVKNFLIGYFDVKPKKFYRRVFAVCP